MNRIQGKLIKLAEEATEVGKEALKAALLPNRLYDGRTAEDRLREELIDLYICARILQSMGVIKKITSEDVVAQFRSKGDRIQKYTTISHQLGALQDPWVPTLEDVV